MFLMKVLLMGVEEDGMANDGDFLSYHVDKFVV
jgi:hypothetical protein